MTTPPLLLRSESRSRIASALREATRALRESGHDLIGFASPPAHDAWPETTGAIVFGTGGRRHWETLSERGRLAGNDPIDDDSRRAGRAVVETLGRAGVAAVAIHPFGADGARIDFVRLGETAGFGTSRTALRLLIHPTYGPWISLRGAVLFDVDVDVEVEVAPVPHAATDDDFDPCGPCPAPCLDACPVRAFGSPAEPRGFDARACADHLASPEAGECLDGCLARRACPVGAAHRYSFAEYRHRHRASTRRLLEFVSAVSATSATSTTCTVSTRPPDGIDETPETTP